MSLARRKHPGGLSTQGARPKLFQSPPTLLAAPRTISMRSLAMIFVRRGGGAVLPSGKSTAAASSSPASSRRNNSLVSSLNSRSRTLGYFSLTARIGPISVPSASSEASPQTDEREPPSHGAVL